MARTESENSGLLLTLDRGIRVLEEIAHSDGRATAKTLSASLEINLGTTYQLLRTLQANGYVNRRAGGRYQLGARIGFLIDHYKLQTAPPQSILDTLHDLREATEETVYVSLAQGTDITIVASLEGTQRIRVGKSSVGYSAHPHARASGKAFLAFCDAQDLPLYLPEGDLERMTPNTITDRDELSSELAKIRAEGVAYDREEFDEGIACIGTVILGDDGKPVGAYAASLPHGRFQTQHESVTVELLKAAETASRSIGYVGPYPPHG
ncbi:MAG: IclR family transcriptional regulator [Acidimicrobiia bacterium]|nr:IclR family transcriptional regulator [Acidimicrobiia bacterium]